MLLYFVLTLLLVAGCSWGPGMHLAFGSFVLREARRRLPARTANLLRSERDAFLYGNVAADIISIKGWGGHHNHCHRWTIVDEMLEAAETPQQRAFALGYQAHLAADTIAHNHYVPYHLARYARSKGFGHMYWEMRADSFVSETVWRLATRLKDNSDLRAMDALVMRFVPKRVLPDMANRMLFDHVLMVAQRDTWRRAVERVHEASSAPLDSAFLTEFRDASLERILLTLDGPPHALAHVDPTGREAQSAAWLMRKRTLATTVLTSTRVRVAEEVSAPFLEGMETPPESSGQPLW
ncbi:MAG: zinc dependent phospholipase C family protein [Planctomycetota bacterium]